MPEVPWRPPLQRLTRQQYNNTVRDLLGVTGDPAAMFSEDETPAGFAANTKLPVQELQLDQYQQAAEAVAAQAINNMAMFVPCSPANGNEAACTTQFIQTLGKRAFRRPLTTDEVNRYQALFAFARMSGDFSLGVSLVIRAMLQSPYFLYRFEFGAPGAQPESDGAVALSQYELASRLSYFIWNSMPDDRLMAAADGNQLGDPKLLADMARQMLNDPKARDGLEEFHTYWLGLTGLPNTSKTDPTFTPELRAAMGSEVIDFVDNVIRSGDGKLDTLLTANYSVITGPLYGLYGLPPPAGGPTTPMQVTLPSNRIGVLMLPAVMTTHAHADQTSLVHRGKMVREQFLCAIIPDPPPNVDTTPPPVDPNVPARVRFEEHRKNPVCGACHNLMDPLGETFEEFDAIGRYRTMDGNQPVDASGVLTGTAKEDGNLANALDLAHRLAMADEVKQCMATQWFRYAFAHMEGMDDAGTIANGLSAFQGAGYRIEDLMVAYALSRSFRYRLPVQLQ